MRPSDFFFLSQGGNFVHGVVELVKFVVKTAVLLAIFIVIVAVLIYVKFF